MEVFSIYLATPSLLTENDSVLMNALAILVILALLFAIATLFTTRIPLAIPVILTDVALLVWVWNGRGG